MSMALGNVNNKGETVEDGWTPDALDRLWRMLVEPVKCRRERTRAQRQWLEANDPPSRLDREDRRAPDLTCAMCGKRTRATSGFCSHGCEQEYEGTNREMGMTK